MATTLAQGTIIYCRLHQYISLLTGLPTPTLKLLQSGLGSTTEIILQVIQISA